MPLFPCIYGHLRDIHQNKDLYDVKYLFNYLFENNIAYLSSLLVFSFPTFLLTNNANNANCDGHNVCGIWAGYVHQSNKSSILRVSSIVWPYWLQSSLSRGKMWLKYALFCQFSWIEDSHSNEQNGGFIFALIVALNLYSEPQTLLHSYFCMRCHFD